MFLFGAQFTLRYMLAYGTVRDVASKLEPEYKAGPANQLPRNHISRRHSILI